MKTTLIQPTRAALLRHGAQPCPDWAGFDATRVPGVLLGADVDVPFPPPRGAPV